jgi:hypothetical protein
VQKLLLMLRRALLMQLGTSRIASFYFVVVFVLVARMLCVFVYYCMGLLSLCCDVLRWFHVVF